MTTPFPLGENGGKKSTLAHSRPAPRLPLCGMERNRQRHLPSCLPGYNHAALAVSRLRATLVLRGSSQMSVFIYFGGEPQ